MATPNYDINYDDKRFAEVESDKKAALTEMEKTYGKQNADGTYTGGLIGNADKYYQDQINEAQKWADKQTQIQNEQTDFAIDKIEQQKAQAKKDYTKEQSGAYVDWQKQSGRYGVEAEQRAAMGMANTGYSESAQVSMYNQYQNRVAVARESFNRAVLEYDNGIREAKLKNNATLAEIQHQALQKKLELSLAGFQYKNQLIAERLAQKQTLENTYYQRYQAVIDQINKENALKEEVRQFNETQKETEEYHDDIIKNQNAPLALERDKFAWQKELTELEKAMEKKNASLGRVGTGARTAIKKTASKLKSSSSSSKKRDSSTIRNAKSEAQRERKRYKYTYDTAAEALQRLGVTTGDGGLMTKTEWTRRKNSGSNRAPAKYSTYEEYLQSYVEYHKSKLDH